MTRLRRQHPERLAEKLLVIRQGLKLSQSQIGRELGFSSAFHRVSMYESGDREPNLMVLLRYARLAGVSTDVLIDDEQELSKSKARNYCLR